MFQQRIFQSWPDIVWIDRRLAQQLRRLPSAMAQHLRGRRAEWKVLSYSRRWNSASCLPEGISRTCCCLVVYQGTEFVFILYFFKHSVTWDFEDCERLRFTTWPKVHGQLSIEPWMWFRSWTGKARGRCFKASFILMIFCSILKKLWCNKIIYSIW